MEENQSIVTDLDKLEAELESLISIASKRSPGEWRSISGDSYCAYPTVIKGDGPHFILYDVSDVEKETAEADLRFPGMDADAAFVAACAGPSEESWSALLSVIKFLRRHADHSFIAIEALNRIVSNCKKMLNKAPSATV